MRSKRKESDVQPNVSAEPTSVRIRGPVRATIEAHAKRERRSLAAQIEVIVEEWNAAKKGKS